MAAVEAVVSSAFSPYLPSFPKFPLCSKSLPCIRLHNPASNPNLFLKFPSCPIPFVSINPAKKLARIEVYSAVEEIAVEEQPEQKTHQSNQRRKLFVLNLPWSLAVDDIKNVFGECGTVEDVEIIKHKDGKSRGFAFITMASGEEAQAVIDKFDSHELSGRIIRVEFAKKFKRPSPPPPAGPPVRETRHKLYVSNLAWKVRSNHLRETFSADFNPVSAKVVFENPSGRSAGYGFVSFDTKEEAEAALSALDGKELLGRPLRLKFSERNIEVSLNGIEEESNPEESQKS